MKEKIIEALNKIRPHLRSDGGDVEFVSEENGVVKVKLTGACAGCPMSALTLQNFVEQVLKQEMPDVKSVESVQ